MDSQRLSVLPDMYKSIGAVCAYQAYWHHPDRTTMDESEEDDAKRTKEYNKLRQKHIGQAEKALRLAQTYMTIEKWDDDDSLIGLPEAEAWCYSDELDNEDCDLVNQRLSSDFITRSMAASPMRPTRLLA